MSISSGLLVLLVVLFLLIAVSIISRKLKWFGQLSGDIRDAGRHTRVSAPLASMLLLSPVLSLAFYLLNAIF